MSNLLSSSSCTNVQPAQPVPTTAMVGLSDAAFAAMCRERVCAWERVVGILEVGMVVWLCFCWAVMDFGNACALNARDGCSITESLIDLYLIILRLERILVHEVLIIMVY